MSILPQKRPHDMPSYLSWKTHSETLKQTGLRGLFEKDSNRFESFSFSPSQGSAKDSFMVDVSRNFISEKTLDIWEKFSEEIELTKAKKCMQGNLAINETEERTTPHTLFRTPLYQQPKTWQKALKEVGNFIRKIRSQELLGYDQQTITDIVHIGIGGSLLGPKLLSEALYSERIDGIRLHFASYLENSPQLLSQLRPERTLFLFVSKSMESDEIVLSLKIAKTWFLHSATEEDWQHHVYIVSSNTELASKLNSSKGHIFSIPPETNGRFSIWSPVSLSVQSVLREGAFEEFLAGAHDMDEHFWTSPFRENIPTLLACLSFQYLHFWHFTHHAIIPYHGSLSSLIPYLQQLVMESLGKSVDRTGKPTFYPTYPLVFGEIGTQVQHSLSQALHQGTLVIPSDLILFGKTTGSASCTEFLLSNGLAQAQALLNGKTYLGEEHKSCVGNRPSNLFLLKNLSPYTLGMLIACYEHKTFVESILQNVHAFDQWGVELGKKMVVKLRSGMRH
ncbi:MAG: hypothetical protein OXB93_03850 [Cytophagales bacterium]|nr:hypothetical protein [Cytophagales bacterium]